AEQDSKHRWHRRSRCAACLGPAVEPKHDQRSRADEARHGLAFTGPERSTDVFFSNGRAIASRITTLRKIFYEILRSRIDNAYLNSTLDTPERFSLKSSERVLKDNHAFN